MRCRTCHQEIVPTTLWGFPVVIKTEGPDIPVPFVQPQGGLAFDARVDVDELYMRIKDARLRGEL